ncbi:MAG: RnfABCDGE type electron transport complex subunit B [Rhodospirillaceae bacterium]
MLLAIGSLAVMGATLGTVLGVASRYLAVESDPLEADLLEILPGSQCGQCGYVGCGPAAEALAAGTAPVTLCVPGGKSVAEKLAKRLGMAADLSGHADADPVHATIDEDKCIGCLRCVNECSSDAIIGAAKQVHTVLTDNCHGCQKCFHTCPTMAVSMQKINISLNDWHWEKPKLMSKRPRH